MREKWFSYRQLAPRRTRLSPKAAEPTIIVAFATVFDAEIARVAVSPTIIQLCNRGSAYPTVALPVLTTRVRTAVLNQLVNTIRYDNIY